jgi:hypothetical protein
LREKKIAWPPNPRALASLARLLTSYSKTKFIGPKGGASDARLKDDRLVPGAEVRLVIAGNNRTCREVHLPVRKTRQVTEVGRQSLDKLMVARSRDADVLAVTVAEPADGQGVGWRCGSQTRLYETHGSLPAPATRSSGTSAMKSRVSAATTDARCWQTILPRWFISLESNLAAREKADVDHSAAVLPPNRLGNIHLWRELGVKPLCGAQVVMENEWEPAHFWRSKERRDIRIAEPVGAGDGARRQIEYAPSASAQEPGTRRQDRGRASR